MHKEVTCIPDSVVDSLRRHDWPGNIRELQNVMERAVILSSGPILRLPLEELNLLAGMDRPSTPRTLEDSERGCILAVLRDVGWVVGGSHGAAQRLGVPGRRSPTRCGNLESLPGDGRLQLRRNLMAGS